MNAHYIAFVFHFSQLLHLPLVKIKVFPVLFIICFWRILSKTDPGSISLLNIQIPRNFDIEVKFDVRDWQFVGPLDCLLIGIVKKLILLLEKGVFSINLYTISMPGFILCINMSFIVP